MTRPLASLPMYDFPELRPATDALWDGIRAQLRDTGIDAPETLDRREAYSEVWTDPGLVLSQTCGYPYSMQLRGRVRLVATPVYRAMGCDGPRYTSVLVVRADDAAETLEGFRGRCAAYNARDSQSGMNTMRAALAPLARQGRFLGTAIETGSHAASADAVASGRADIAALDCVTWAHLAALRPELTARLRVLGLTPSAPALPFVTAANQSDATVSALATALSEAIADPALAPARDALLIEGVEMLADDAYDEIPAMEASARRAGYPDLA
ncbi:PhnD/SsuA/transferrin family substrate-binding protein [Limibaculum sp. M0105]|uniref:PhnD/SsuA/transferrin family substrate-binding protein n=1 Tax=Thermohalobaculum xanthum TaxID=2753746 RepID=A0A8J7M7I0_9RHOB|nr:PhnD/SsuA/transferrin family substrate-binding protein [Thermohalobaculum xanthum]MBK0399135.1 PhnD/SsuA/transferrin family substrate-binding protein [Thermohalobaculum xanthum]